MRWTDLLTLPLGALWQQKLRTALTTLGVVFGAFVLAASLSIGQGVQETIERETRRSDVARRVEVYSDWEFPKTKARDDDVKVEGAMSDARRERIRARMAFLKRAGDPDQEAARLTHDRLKAVGALPHVQRLIPLFQDQGFALLGLKTETVHIASVRPEDQSYRRRVVAGRFFERPDERGIVLDEFLAYRLGAVDEADVRRLIGKPVKLEFRSEQPVSGLGVFLYTPGRLMNRAERAAVDELNARLPAALESIDLGGPETEVLRNALRNVSNKEVDTYAEEYPVLGVIRMLTSEDPEESWDPLTVYGDVLLPYQTATGLYFHAPGRDKRGIHRAVVVVDAEEHVKEVVARVKALGLRPHAAIEFIDRQRLIYLLIFGGMTSVAAVALLVSALGIANTMLMSVLERTREIGVMKAVGADNRHLQWVFLLEGAVIGLLGGTVGLLLAWSVSYPADAWICAMVVRDLDLKFKGSIFVFPAWMAVVVMLFTVLVTTLAAVYPARHAAGVDPVKALRHE